MSGSKRATSLERWSERARSFDLDGVDDAVDETRQSHRFTDEYERWNVGSIASDRRVRHPHL